jgi:hypothetical protein
MPRGQEIRRNLADLVSGSEDPAYVCAPADGSIAVIGRTFRFGNHEEHDSLLISWSADLL